VSRELFNSNDQNLASHLLFHKHDSSLDALQLPQSLRDGFMYENDLASFEKRPKWIKLIDAPSHVKRAIPVANKTDCENRVITPAEGKRSADAHNLRNHKTSALNWKGILNLLQIIAEIADTEEDPEQPTIVETAG
jgi:hypothetical protein